VEQLKSFIQNGQITKETLAWKEGMAEWVKAENLPEINQLFGTSTPPPPPPSQP
jgi:hypothetical protein